MERLHIASGAAQTKLLWKAYQPTVAWPKSMALTDKGRYSIAFESDDTKSTLQIRILPPSLKNDDARLIWMIAQGTCAVQARLLAKALAPQ